MFTHNLNPVLISIGGFSIYYYSLAYIVGFIAVYLVLKYTAKKGVLNLSEKQIDYLLTSIVLGTIVGGRLGFMLFYNPAQLFTLEAFAIRNGGMSFHGGLAGVAIAIILFAKFNKISVLKIMDILVIPALIGLMLGRIANFINGELWGTPTQVPWCVVFPQVDELCRHPSQLYEALQNVVQLAIIWPLVYTKLYKKGLPVAVFLITYGLMRFTVNFVRVPTIDGLFGISVGQWLSLVTALCGFVLLWYIYHEKS